jgi:hypothetical protein
LPYPELIEIVRFLKPIDFVRDIWNSSTRPSFRQARAGGLALLCIAGGTRGSASLVLAGSEIGEDHFVILYDIDRKTGGILTAASQQKAAGGDGLAISRCFARLLGTNTGRDHGIGHSLLLLYDAKAPNCQKSKNFKGLGHYPCNTILSLFRTIDKLQ